MGNTTLFIAIDKSEKKLLEKMLGVAIFNGNHVDAKPYTPDGDEYSVICALFNKVVLGEPQASETTHNALDRLTQRENPTKCKAGCRVGKECCYAGCVNFQKVQNRLAEYEDTGLSPAEVAALITKSGGKV